MFKVQKNSSWRLLSSEWQTEELAKSFLEGVRGAIPGAELQFDVIAKIVQLWFPHPRFVLDLGCGNGVLGKFLLERFPSGDGFFVDFSEPMLAAARDNLRLLSRKRIIKADFSTAEWIDCVSEPNPMDVLISGFAIHHQPDERKQMLYSEIFSLLSHRYLYLAS